MSVTRLWVDDGFKKKIKVEASKKGMSILDFTQELAKKEDDFSIFGKKKNDKKGFSFKFP